jgi:hypothetical protein
MPSIDCAWQMDTRTAIITVVTITHVRVLI